MDPEIIEASWAPREVTLEEAHGRGHLGPRVNKSSEPRNIITARETTNAAVYAKLCGVYKGQFGDQPAILLITDFTFREKGARIDEALITFTFAASKPQNTTSTAATRQCPRAVRLYSPKAISGAMREEMHCFEYGGTFEFSVSAGPLSIGSAIHASNSVETKVEKQLTVTGYEFSDDPDEDEPNQAVFKIERHGAAQLPSSFPFGIIVERHQDLQADIKIEVNRRAFGYPWSRKDDPLLLPVNWKGEKLLGAEPFKFEDMTADKWRELVSYKMESEVSCMEV